MIIEYIEDEPSQIEIVCRNRRKSSFLSIEFNAAAYLRASQSDITTTQTSLPPKILKECRVCLENSD